MDPQLRAFSVEEAEALIPTLTQLLNQLRQRQKEAVDLEAQIDALELIAEKGSDKAVQELSRLTESHHAKVTEFYAIIDKIHSFGCVLKDAEIGLIDFYTILNKKVVYLCWRIGEDHINFWHDTGKGYGSREMLSNPPESED